ncbi:hypothetical protein SAMN05428988_3166 [Chitinophaga sp. YR573]|uniref:hypothetical protein n=1 Tax=Chitinophaga sp. YR573 TaxID=1881040 RepID=UPI0008B0F19A|nr:hypothetical protein [Chitinophaga sp. YR573]SEW21054.1 hypothetical protein SAMN05428988_3166 [Chitinophaga sp. YR573]
MSVTKKFKEKMVSLLQVVSTLRRFQDKPYLGLLESILMEYVKMLDDAIFTSTRLIELQNSFLGLLEALDIHHNDSHTQYVYEEFQNITSEIQPLINQNLSLAS